MSRRSKQLTDRGYVEVSRFFRALSEPLRLQMIDLLREGPCSVGEIAEELGCSQPTASRQLATLERAGVLAKERHGATVQYAIVDPAIHRLCEIACGRLEKSLVKLFR